MKLVEHAAALAERRRRARAALLGGAALGYGIYRLVVRFGFIEDPNIPALLATVKGPVTFDPMSTSYFLGRETLIATRAPGMAIWREKLFAWMMRNSSSASQFFCLPPNQVIELGAQIEL